MSDSQFRREFLFTPGYDNRTKVQGGTIHPMHLELVLKWPLQGQVQMALNLEINTGWYPSTVRQIRGRGWNHGECCGCATSWDVYEHLIVQAQENQYRRDDCGHLDGQACWSSSWSTLAEIWFKLFIDEGLEVIWPKMEKLAKKRLELLFQAQRSQTEWVQALGY